MGKPKQNIDGIWVIRAGKNGDAHNFFMNNNLLVLKDDQMGNLGKIDPTREAFYHAYRKIHPNATKTGSAGIGGKYYRFVHEVKIGDFILYPCLKDKQIYVGKIKGCYVYASTADLECYHQRSVQWLYYFPKSALTEFAKRELGAARTFFKLKSHYQEVMRLINGGQAESFLVR